MRLIEVADLEKFIRENVCAIGNDHLLLVAGDDGKWHEALPLVKTAYSVDRVVEELEKTMQDLSVIEVFSHIDFDSTIQSGLDNFLKSYNSELLRIVKQGIISDDVCEWHKVKNGNAYKCNTHAEIHDSRVLDWCVCPYCGKKIKVVE